MSGAHSSSDPAEPAWVTEVLDFWFEELGEAHWFSRNDGLDARIRGRFLPLHERLVAHDGCVSATPRALLAAVIVLDQFSRNLFRGTPGAFAADPIARRLSRFAIHRGFDAGMKEQERLFLYMPFEHSEDREDQALAVTLIARLGNDDWTHYAIEHRAIIDRFGRFPHRNAILNRPSSADEVALLQQPAECSPHQAVGPLLAIKRRLMVPLSQAHSLSPSSA
jgi:uncharacterized protein (DUF924 family)